jgi:co-chaperonin GroES (HSP10)
MATKKVGGAADLFPAGGSAKFTHKIRTLTPLKDNVIVRDMSFEGRKLSSGILLLNDDGKSEGIRPRWAQVHSVGPEQKDIKAGQWILVEHGRWSRGLEVEINDEEFTIRRVDPKSIIFATDERPSEDDTISTAVVSQKKSLYE